MSAKVVNVHDVLARILADVLQVSVAEVSRPDANFFGLGGVSLDVLRVNARLLDDLGMEIPLEYFFLDGQIKFLTSYLSDHAQESLAQPGPLD